MSVSPELVVIIDNSDTLKDRTELLRNGISRHPSFQATILNPAEAIRLIEDSRQKRQPVAGVIIADRKLGFRHIGGIMLSGIIRAKFGRLPPIGMLVPRSSMASDQQVMRDAGVNVLMGTEFDDAEVGASLVSFGMITKTLSGGRDHTSALNRHFERHGLYILQTSWNGRPPSY